MYIHIPLSCVTESVLCKNEHVFMWTDSVCRWRISCPL